MENKVIEWGYEDPAYIRSEEHRKYLIQEYNKNRPEHEHVHSMEELNRALLNNEIKSLNVNSK